IENSLGKVAKIDIVDILQPQRLLGSWEIRFPKGWGAPESVMFDSLKSWTKDSEPGVKYFSGTACYRKQFDVPGKMLEKGKYFYLDLGEVKNIAEVSLNGKKLGILWKKPFRVNITDAIKVGKNELEVRITNLWPNRLIGDQFLPENQRYTHTNIKKFTRDSPLMESGLLGPVRILAAQVVEVRL
ncbi:MAG: glycosyl transferase family 2, partial [Calditrichaeota bacterium]|nr:glycosyl transferase family 2 [Calditrichota bacterium]